MLDEVHERSVQSDFLTIVIKDILPHRCIQHYQRIYAVYMMVYVCTYIWIFCIPAIRKALMYIYMCLKGVNMHAH